MLNQAKLTQAIYNAYYRQMKLRDPAAKLQPWISLDGKEVALWSGVAADVLEAIKSPEN